MKVSGKGVVTILLFLLVIPVIVDLILVMVLPKDGSSFGMSRFLTVGYLKALPFYIGYLIIAFTVIYLYKNRKKDQSR